MKMKIIVYLITSYYFNRVRRKYSELIKKLNELNVLHSVYSLMMDKYCINIMSSEFYLPLNGNMNDKIVLMKYFIRTMKSNMDKIQEIKIHDDENKAF